jgi:hypothetical protein
VTWLTGGGLSPTPFPILFATPTPLRNAHVAELTIEPGTWTGFAIFLVVPSGAVVSSDVILAVRPGVAAAGGVR